MFKQFSRGAKSLNLQRSSGIQLERSQKRQLLADKKVTSLADKQNQELERRKKAKSLALRARFCDAELKRLHDDRGDLRAATVDLALLAAPVAILRPSL